MASNPTFPDEIIIEILLKLPIKSILRCNTLSKHYYSVIHSQFFIRRHLNLGRLANELNDRLIVSSVGESLRLFNRRSGCFMELDFSTTLFVDKDSELMIMICGPIDGLYCVTDHRNNGDISLWNPATLEEFILPLPPYTNDYLEDDALAEKHMYEIFNYFLNRETCLACGFGYDIITNNYKVVIIYGSMLDTSSNMYMYIFNVSKRDWIYHEEQLDVNSWRLNTSDGVFLHGACHWLYSFLRGSIVSFSDPGFNILAFDMSTELSRTISFLGDVKDGYALYETTIIATLNKCLALIVSTAEDVDRRFMSFNVWIMGEYGVTESWSIMYRVSLPLGTVGRSLGITGDRFYVIEGDKWLVSYDLDSKDVERYDILDSSIYSLLPYEESLVRIISS